MTKIVAFAGRKQSGKTTCAWYIQNLIFRDFQPQYRCDIYNFADPLKKDICMNILGLSYEQCYGEDVYKNTLTEIQWNGSKLTAREVMQFIGTDIFRKMKPDVWASATINKIQQLPSIERNGYIAIVADCRFPNEVQAVKDAGGYVIKLTRNPYNSDHESEMALDESQYPQNNFDLIINNEYLTIDQQNKEVHNFLKKKDILPL